MTKIEETVRNYLKPNETKEDIEQFDWLSLTDGEEVVEFRHPSVYKFLADIIVGVVLILAGVYSYVFIVPNLGLTGTGENVANWISAGVILIGFSGIIFEVLRYRKTYYIATTEHVKKKTTILNKNPDSIPLDEIQMAQLRQRLLGLEEYLGFGHITISSAATSGREMHLPYVPEPGKFKAAVKDDEN